MSARSVAACVLCAAVLWPVAGLAQGPQSNRRPTLEEDLAAITAFNAKYLKALNDEDIEPVSRPRITS